MKLNLLTFNVHGLNDPVSIPKLKHYLSASPQVDILLLQEHKLRLQVAQELGAKLWKGVETWILDACPGYGHLPHLLGVDKGGICTLITPRLKHNVTQIGSVMENKVHWLILDNLPGGPIGITNIYAPNDSHSRCILWEQMMLELPTQCSWIFAGDMNMVKNRHDKTNPCDKLLPIQERAIFTTLKRHFSVEDNPRSHGSLMFSWDNLQGDGSRILAHLDRMYIFKSSPGHASRQILRYGIQGDNPWSYHVPVELSLELGENVVRKSRWHMSSLWLEEARLGIEATWHQLRPGLPFHTKPKAIS